MFLAYIAFWMIIVGLVTYCALYIFEKIEIKATQSAIRRQIEEKIDDTLFHDNQAQVIKEFREFSNEHGLNGKDDVKNFINS